MRIEIKDLTYSYGKAKALDGVNLTLQENTIYGLLGRNGAGKSTLLKLLSNRLLAQQGTITLDGVDVRENDAVQNKIYLMSESNLYPRNMQIKEVFKWTKRFYGNFDTQRAMELCTRFEIDPKKTVSALSTGQNTIYKAIIALCLCVPFIFFDEPVLGMDAGNRDLFYKELLKSYEECPRTFVIATHLIEEVSGLIENIIIVKDGKIIADRSIEDLMSHAYTLSGSVEEIEKYRKVHQPIATETLGKMQTAYFLDEPFDAALGKDLKRGNVELQDLFVKLTNA